MLQLPPSMASVVMPCRGVILSSKFLTSSSPFIARFLPAAFYPAFTIPATRLNHTWCRVNQYGDSSHSPLKYGSNFRDQPNTETTPPFPGCDCEHWLVVMDKPGGEGATKQQMIDCYVQTLSKVLGSEEEAKKKIYNVSCERYFGFGCEIDKETSNKLEGLPGVLFVLPDSYVDVQNKDYRGRGREEHPVHCKVDVVSWRERRIHAHVVVAADVDSVWTVLTDYERLADFIPNLVYSGTVPCPHEGRIWLEQRGMQRALYWHIEARVLLDLQEFPNSIDGNELHFSMVDGDFKKFEGKWSVKAVPRSRKSILSYEVNVIPKFNFPAMFIERIISSDLPVNLRALACRSETFSKSKQKIYKSGNTAFSSGNSTESSETVVKDLSKHFAASAVTSLPSPSITDNINKWGIFAKVCNLDRPCMVDEVHLRRFDGLLENGGVHRCVVASITVKAPPSEVWNVLTAYEKLPEIVPNLAISKVMLRENNKVRILQEGCKGLLYMVLHARVVMDLHETFEQEITFEQVEGDFDSFHGKWILEQLGNQHTLLKYAIESKLHKDAFLSEAIVEEVIYEDLPSNLCAIRDFVENRNPPLSNMLSSTESPQNTTITDDNKGQAREVSLARVVSTCTEVSSTKEVSTFKTSISPKQRSKVPGLQRDIGVLKSELLSFISKHGQEGFMPMRKQLRLHGRVDIEKAIARMGGFRKIAHSMNLSLAYKDRKPKGYWDNLENLQKEISRFQRNWGMDPMYMPSRKSFERAGRYDIARALEKWGGLHQVSRLLSLELRHPRKQAANSMTDEKKNGSSPSYHSASNEKGSFSQGTDKWLLKLKDLDINWLE